MKDPNSAIFKSWQDLMATGEMTGRNRPVGRITLSKNTLKGHVSDRPGIWRNILFEQQFEAELFNVKSIDIDRSVSQDAASCSITLYNDDMPYHDYKPEGADVGQSIGKPGYLSPYRGQNPESAKSVYDDLNPGGDYPTSWGYDPNAYIPGTAEHNAYWYMGNRLVPNRVIRTYQGYGSANMTPDGDFYGILDDQYVPPEHDFKLTQTGVWLIDRVTYGTNGMISVECRDLAKLLLEQFIYPDMIPLSRFPLIYKPALESTYTEEEERVVPPEIGQNVATFRKSSNLPHYGDAASVHGHRPRDAFDGRPDTYWLSVGNASPNSGYSYEHIEANTGGNPINEVFVHVRGSGYKMFLSLKVGGVWMGDNTIGYDPNNPASFPNGSNIKYVQVATVGSESQEVHFKFDTLPVEAVRVTFTNLWNSGLGTYPYRAAVREFRARVRKERTVETVTSTIERTDVTPPGHVLDWSSAVKELLGWAGFTWYANPKKGYENIPADPLLGKDKATGVPLRIWGDLEVFGAGPIHDTPPDFFMNKSFMEGINILKDMIGAIFMVDESGGAVFRLPNIYGSGNFIHDPESTETRAYIREHPIEFHENANLIDYSVTIDDSQLRSEILVIGEKPDTFSEGFIAGGAVLAGGSDADPTMDFTDELGGQTRLFVVPGDQTKGFHTIEECRRMAEMTAIFIYFTYRKGTLSAPAHPGLQVDDQVRIFERVTSDSYVHYVSGLSTHMDLDTGEYTMDVSTHWLGDDPASLWFLDSLDLTPAVLNLPAVMAALDRGGNTSTGKPKPTNHPDWVLLKPVLTAAGHDWGALVNNEDALVAAAYTGTDVGAYVNVEDIVRILRDFEDMGG